MLGGIIGWLKYGSAAGETKERHKNQAALIADLESRIARRFQNSVFIVPLELQHKLGRKDCVFGLVEDDWDWWSGILEQFPIAPRTQDEAQQNEARFWRAYAKQFSTQTPSGESALVSHAKILYYYDHSEKWILRHYFAATGKVIEPKVQEWSRLLMERRQIAGKHWWDDKSRAKQESAVERLDQEIRHWNNHTKKAHHERWGGWFVAHIEDAFNQVNKPKQQSSGNEHGEGGFATAADINSMRSSARTPFRRPAAHEQEFDE